MIVDRNTTAIVVDSTADLPDDLAAHPNITVVPLTVYFGEEAYLDWVEMKPEQFYEKLLKATSVDLETMDAARTKRDELGAKITAVIPKEFESLTG